MTLRRAAFFVGTTLVLASVAAVALLDSPRAGPPDTVSDFRDELAAA